MKVLLHFLCLLVGVVNGLAQIPTGMPSPIPTETPVAATTAPVAMSQSIFLDVKDLGTNLSSDSNWRSAWGSYSKNMTRARGLDITLRNPAKIPGEYLVEWYFFGVPARGGKRFLFDRDSKTVAVPPGGMEHATVLSEEMESTQTHYSSDYYYYSSTYKSGNKPEGWIVTVSIGGKLQRIKTSSGQLDQLYKTQADLQTLGDPIRKKREK